jgi:hypothetical protein
MSPDELGAPEPKRPPTRGELRARAMAIAIAGAIGLVIIAAATSGGFAFGEKGGSGGLLAPKLPSFAAWVLVPLLVVAIITSMAVLTQVVAGRSVTRPTRSPLWVQFLTVVFVVLGVVALQNAGFFGRGGDDANRDQIAKEGGNRASPAPDAGEPARSPAFGVAVTVVLALGLGAIVLITTSVLRKERGVREELHDPETVALLEGVDAGIDDLSTITDPRAAVIACYARMESALAVAGLAKRPAEAPLEFLARILTERNVLESSATTLTALFERARFSDHAVDETMRAAALAALRGVRDQVWSGA